MTTKEDEILYVEDDASDVELTLIALERAGIASNIHTARDGAEALDYLFCRGLHSARDFCIPKFVLLDLKLPKVSGLEVLHAIREDPRTRIVPVVILTSSREQRDLIDSYELGVNSYVQKPVNFEQFNQTIQQVGLYWLVLNQTPSDRNFSLSKR